MLSITLLFQALAAGSVLASSPSLSPINRRASTGLNTAIQSSGKLYFGSATDNPELTNTNYTLQLNNTLDFGQITPGNSMKWEFIEPSRNTFTYTAGDQIASLAHSNGQKLRCHNLVWYQELPSWVTAGNFDNATLVSILQNHITNEVTHYKGQCYAWDVVNEALSDAGDGSYRSNVFFDTIGEAYVPIAFAAAAAADPDAKLYYNDYGIESAGAKATAAVDLVKMVQAYGAKIDGVGFESHFIVGETPSAAAQVASMQAFTALGVDVAVTELDIRTITPETAAAETQQALDYASTVNACIQVDECVGVTLWDWTDKYSWVPSTFPGYGAACPWDENLQKKVDVYDAILLAVGRGSGNVSASAATAAASASVATTSTAGPVTTSSAAGAVVSSSAASSVADAASTTTAIGSTSSIAPAATSGPSSVGADGSTSIALSSAAVVPTTFSTIATLTAAVSTAAPGGECEVEYVYA